MTVETFSLFFAMLTVIADVLVVGALALALTARVRRSGTATRALAGARTVAQDRGLAFAWIVALTATLGSLYYSEVAGYVPCRLCWYQRIAMYPLVVVLGVAASKRDAGVRGYVLPLAGIGGAIAAYHYVLQRFPALESSACDLSAPCSQTWVWPFHFVSIPFMALSAFALIGTTLVLGRPGHRAGGGDAAAEPMGQADDVPTEHRPHEVMAR